MAMRGERRKDEVPVTDDGAPLDWRASLAVWESLADGSGVGLPDVGADRRSCPCKYRGLLPVEGLAADPDGGPWTMTIDITELWTDSPEFAIAKRVLLDRYAQLRSRHAPSGPQTLKRELTPRERVASSYTVIIVQHADIATTA